MSVTLVALVVACAIAWVSQGWQTRLTILLLLGVIRVVVSQSRWLYVAAKTASRDFRSVYYYLKVLWLNRKLTRKNWAISDIFHDVKKRHPYKACFIFKDQVWTFQQVEDFSLRTSAVFRAMGMKNGDVVGIIMSNCPDLPSLWLGISRLGGVSAVINTNQTGSILLHSLNVVKCKFIIYGDEFEEAIQEVSKGIDSSTKLLKYTYRPVNTSVTAVSVRESPNDLTSMLETTTTPPWFLSEGDGIHGKLLYIYTSGTTGLPKAAVISTTRMVFASGSIHYFGGLSSDDVIYCPMPLYHSAGGSTTMGMAFIFGCTIILRKKFSASGFFKDCIMYNATVAQYIGEMCRYILATQPSPYDTQHKVRLMYGNGLRPQIWKEFVKRFNIKRVSELYGSTEGNASMLNVDNKIGAVGFISRIFPAMFNIAIIKYDSDCGQPIRNSKGLCQLAKPNEPGMLIGTINPERPAEAFLGYANREDTEKKIIRDVLKLGDSAFATGDILVADELGYLYFRDRTGDTFRWRGENVSTTEVEAVISRAVEQRDTVVYGVEILNTEGRAGMCGILDPDNTLNLEQLIQAFNKDLPKYARPIFIRKMESLDMTGTFKIKKVNLQKEGFSPAVVSDKLYYLDPKLDKYLPLENKEYDDIITGKIRL